MTENRQLGSERIVVSSPLSFSGSAKRIWRIAAGDRNPWAKAGLAALAVLLIAVVWCFVVIWYCLCLLFFVPFIVFRMFRRSARKDKAAKLRHRETLDQLEAANPRDQAR